MMRRLRWVLPVLGMALVASPARAQYELLQERIRKSWDKVTPAKGKELVRVEYSTANSLFAHHGRAMGGNGVLFPGGTHAYYAFEELGRRYELACKGPQTAFRAGKQGPFKKVEPADVKQHTVLLSFIRAQDLVNQLLVTVEHVRPAGTTNVQGKQCQVYEVTYQETHLSGLLRRLGLDLPPVEGRKRKKRGLEAQFYIETATGRLRQMTVSLRVEVKKPDKKQAKSKKDWSWESYDSGDSMMRAGVREEGKEPGAVGREARSLIRQFSMKAVFHSPAVPKQPIVVPDQARELLNW